MLTEGVFDLLRQIREDFPEEETFELRWGRSHLFQAGVMNLCKRTREHLVGNSLKLGTGKTKGRRRGGTRLH